jgi:hypothetical protein
MSGVRRNDGDHFSIQFRQLCVIQEAIDTARQHRWIIVVPTTC